MKRPFLKLRFLLILGAFCAIFFLFFDKKEALLDKAPKYLTKIDNEAIFHSVLLEKNDLKEPDTSDTSQIFISTLSKDHQSAKKLLRALEKLLVPAFLYKTQQNQQEYYYIVAKSQQNQHLAPSVEQIMTQNGFVATSYQLAP